jgi:cytochrome bd-type quinol oxidase subunit 2
MDHFVLLVWHAFLVSVFFAFLWRRKSRERLLFFLKTFLIMFLGGVALGWLMFPFP